jgi:hypothetical protein
MPIPLPDTIPTPTGRRASIPADTRYTLDVYALSATYPNVYQVKVLWRENDIITIETLWFNAAYGVEIPAACANVPTITPTPVATATPVPTATPVATATPVIPDTPLINSIQACENAPGRVRLPNSMTADYADCRAINQTIAGLQGLTESERAVINRLLWLATSGTEADKAEFRQRIEAFFCVRLLEADAANPEAANQWIYQRLNNVFLALLQTSYAFWKTDPSLGGVQGAACAAFRGTLNFQLLTGFSGALTVGNTIYLYAQVGSSVQSAANIIHEIGHYFNAKLGGAIDNPGGPAPTSPLGMLRDGVLKVGAEDISGEMVDPGQFRRGMFKDPYTQNGGWDCNGDISCGRNEEFADMFMNWVYEQAIGPMIFVDDLYGKSRRAFMNDNVLAWIQALVRR